jgi:hypothetical protein
MLARAITRNSPAGAYIGVARVIVCNNPGEAAMTTQPIEWSHPPSRAVARARLIGRRRYNEARQAAAGQRRDLVQEVWLTSGGAWGWQSKLARQLQVHKSTICRDVAMIKAALGLP